MERKIYHQAVFTRRLIATGLLLGLALWVAPRVNLVRAAQGQAKSVEPAVAAFNQRVKDYVKLRDKLEGELPKLSPKSQSAEIETHLVSLQTSIIAAREGAKAGDIFTPDIASHIRSVIKKEFKGRRLRELREDVLKAQTKGVPLRANAAYPETKELIEMPPTLLLKLPTLPKQLRYYFVGHSMILLDKEARLIVDYFPNALP